MKERGWHQIQCRVHPRDRRRSPLSSRIPRRAGRALVRPGARVKRREVCACLARVARALLSSRRVEWRDSEKKGCLGLHVRYVKEVKWCDSGKSHHATGHVMHRQLEWRCQLPLLWRGWHLCEAVGKIKRRGPMRHGRWQIKRPAEQGWERVGQRGSRTCMVEFMKQYVPEILTSPG